MSQGLTAHLTGRVGTLSLDIDLTLPATGVTMLTGPSGAESRPWSGPWLA